MVLYSTRGGARAVVQESHGDPGKNGTIFL